MNQLPLLAEYPEGRAQVEPHSTFMMRVARVGEPLPSQKMDAPELCADYWRNVIAKLPWFDENKEHFIALMLDTRLSITGYSLVSIGSLNETMAYPRETFRAAIVAGAFAVVIMHNHPSNDPSPSQSDHSMTRLMREASEIIHIQLLDHVIVAQSPIAGQQRYFSFREAGVL